MKKKSFIKLFYKILIIILISYISSFIFFRFDLTSENRYTLSEGTKNLMGNLDDIIYIEIYLDGEMPIGFKRLKNSIKELLDEFKIYASENIEYEFINPSESEDKKTRREIFKQIIDKGIIPTNVQDKDAEGAMTQKIIFPGALIIYQGEEYVLNFLKQSQNPRVSAERNLNNSIQALEYEFVNKIYKAIEKKRKKIAFIDGHGELGIPETRDIMISLSEYYDVKRVIINHQLRALNDYEAIVIAKPDSTFDEKDKFVIDQFLMNGGKILWLIDAVNSNLDSLAKKNFTIALPYKDLNLNDILFKYGVRINNDLIQDLQSSVIPVNVSLNKSKPQWRAMPWLYFPLLNSENQHTITKYVNMVKSEFISSIDTVGGNPEINKKILLSSSKYSKIINTPVSISLDILKERINQKKFNKSNIPVAVLLEGKFESVFKNRIPKNILKNKDINFIEKSKKTSQIVVSDGDIIKNIVKISKNGNLQSLPLGTDRYYEHAFTKGNTEFILNAINYLCDDSGLMSVRTREITLRMLDKEKIKKEKLKWQIINVISPLIFVVVFGISLFFIKKNFYKK